MLQQTEEQRFGHKLKVDEAISWIEIANGREQHVNGYLRARNGTCLYCVGLNPDTGRSFSTTLSIYDPSIFTRIDKVSH